MIIEGLLLMTTTAFPPFVVDIFTFPTKWSTVKKGNLTSADFTLEWRRNFTICKKILWEPETASDTEANQKELDLIRSYRSNDLTIGYNR
jgi:hypothetical protein